MRLEDKGVAALAAGIVLASRALWSVVLLSYLGVEWLTVKFFKGVDYVDIFSDDEPPARWP